MRAIAVLMVVLAHAGFPSIPPFESIPGWIGVDLFFAISGFLITHLLLQELRAHGAINLKQFWIRRFLRLMPAYYFYVGFLIVLMLVLPEAVHSGGDTSPTLFVVSLLGYFVNFINEVPIWDYAMLSLHLWSLALEEQFYFVWPILLFFSARLPRLLLVLAMSLLIATCSYTYLFPDDIASSYYLWGRGSSILSGCLAAILGFQMREETRRRIGQWTNWSWLPCFLFLIALTINENIAAGIHQNLLVVPIGISCSFFLITLWHAPRACSCTVRLLSQPALVSIGRISYGIYLYHALVQTIVWSELTNFLHELESRPIVYGTRLLLTIVLTIATAWVSYRYLESPFLRMKDRFRQNQLRATPDSV